MRLFATLPFVLLLAPFLLAQEDPPHCGSCCPPVEPVPDTVGCDTLDAHLDMMKEAIEEAQCADYFGQGPDEVCQAITMKAIPPCMLMEGTTEQTECLAEVAKDIEEELNTGDVEEVGTEVVAMCKCDAFKRIRRSLSSVRDMMCPPSDRTGRNYYGYGANTLWFQYLLCQQESIPSLACWLFTSGWNQADFGQYYLYDNLLGDDGGLGLDGDLLPLLALSGGLGGGAYGGGYAHGGQAYGGGHAVYRREVTCPDGEIEVDGKCPPARKRRESCPDGKIVDGICVKNPARKRRGTCPEGKTEVDGECVARKRRGTCPEGKTEVDGKCVGPARKRRGTCPEGKTEVDGECVGPARKRRGTCPE